MLAHMHGCREGPDLDLATLAALRSCEYGAGLPGEAGQAAEGAADEAAI